MKRRQIREDQDLFGPERKYLMAPYTDPPRSHRNDPETSKDAEPDPETLGRLQTEALEFVKLYPGRTAYELAELAPYKDQRKIPKRLSELEKRKLIKMRGTKINPDSGKECSLWWVFDWSEEGRDGD